MLDLRPAIVTRLQNWAGREAPREQTPAGTSPRHRLLETITRPPQPRKTHALQDSLLSFLGVPKAKSEGLAGTPKSCRGKLADNFSRPPQLSISLVRPRHLSAKAYTNELCCNPPVSTQTSREVVILMYAPEA